MSAIWNKMIPQQNQLQVSSIGGANIKSFNGRLRQVCLNATWFMSLEDPKGKIAAWREYYNESRPHNALERSASIEFARRCMQLPAALTSEKPDISTSDWYKIGDGVSHTECCRIESAHACPFPFKSTRHQLAKYNHADFYKSMTTQADHRVRQHVHRPNTPAGEVYLKLGWPYVEHFGWPRGLSLIKYRESLGLTAYTCPS
jgi:hypothetical protein